MAHKCFMITPNGEATVALRRFHSPRQPQSKYTCATGYHDASIPIGRCRVWKEPYVDPDHDYRSWVYENDAPEVADDDPRWPAKCGCGYQFTADDHRQVSTDRLYVGPDGAEYSLRNPPVGALWWAEWLEDLPNWWKGPDGRILMAKTPGGEWCIDSRASNCTLPKDDEHRCWVRHGEVPNITVDKNGKSCSAGAGSIISGSYHGFLRNGSFT